MKLIHIENKIDPNDVVNVMKQAKEDFARELLICIRNQPNPIYPDGLRFLIADLLQIPEKLL